MRRQIAGVLTLLALAASPLVATSHAAPKACRLVTDKKSDAVAVATPSGLTTSNEPAFDIVSADIASNSKQVAVAIRVAKLTETVSTSPGGSVYLVRFTLPKSGGSHVFALIARITPQGKVFSLSRKSTDPTVPWQKVENAEGLFDVKKNEVRIWVPISSFPKPATFTRGAPVAGLGAAAGRILVPEMREDDTDTAASAKKYTGGAASCLLIGR